MLATLKRPLVLWLLALVPLLAFAGRPAVSRAQEARVLETARQMRGGDLHGYLLPTLNGLPRLKKPPLCYWMTAAAYDLLGVGTFAGRLPTVLVAWLLVGLTYRFGRDLYDESSGLWAAAMLLGSFMFFRFARLAETDPPASLGVAIAVYAMWRGSGFFCVKSKSRKQQFGWFHLSAVGMALAVMAKGGPAGFPILFLILLAWTSGRWSLLWRWVRSGAPLTFAALSAWWLYISLSPAARQIAGELGQFVDGGEHHATFLQYFPQTLAAVAPWTGFVVVAIVGGLLHWRDDPRHRVPLLWAAAVLVPLLLLPKRQDHYLQPLLPPLMLLAGHLNARGTSADGTTEERAWVRWVGVGTSVLGIFGGPTILFAAWKVRGDLGPTDWALALFLTAAAGVSLALLLMRKARAGLLTFALGVIVVVPVLFGLWLPRLAPTDWRQTAAAVSAEVGDAPLRFYGPEISLPLCFHLRRAIPALPDGRAADEFLAANPNGRLIVIRPDSTFIRLLRGTHTGGFTAIAAPK